MKSRDSALDLICGILIIHMILGHIYQWGGKDFTPEYQFSRILSFFMPWFFFKAGMFIKEDLQIKVVLISSAKRLLAPFAFFTFLGQLIYYIKLVIIGEHHTLYFYLISPINSILGTGSAPGNQALWFLLALFIVRLLFIISRLWLIRFIIFLIAPLIFYLKLHLPLLISSTSFGLFFFSFGYLLKNYRPSLALSVGMFSLWLFLQYLYRVFSLMFRKTSFKNT